MRILGLLLVTTLLAGCTSEGTAPSAAHGRRGSPEVSASTVPPELREEYKAAREKADRETSRVRSITPVVGASVCVDEGTNQFRCGKCGSMLDANGACPVCNPQGMPGFGLQQTPHTNQLGSTSPR